MLLSLVQAHETSCSYYHFREDVHRRWAVLGSASFAAEIDEVSNVPGSWKESWRSIASSIRNDTFGDREVRQLRQLNRGKLKNSGEVTSPLLNDTQS